MKIVVLDAYTSCSEGVDYNSLSQLGELTVYDRSPADVIIPRIGAAEIVLTNKAVISAAVMDACPQLKCVCVLATGYNVVDVAYAKKRGIAVCNVPGYSTMSVAQHTFALLLEIVNQVGLHSASVKGGEWQNNADFSYRKAPLTELDGKTLGIVGYGQIGRVVAKIATAFGMNVIAYNRSIFQNDGYASQVLLQQLYQNADIISLHCPLTEANVRMINADAIAQMKDGVILLNTARGGLLDEDAVCAALSDKKLRAVGVDVLCAEPPREGGKLLLHPSVFVTPHIAWATAEARARLIAVTYANVEAYIKGAPINNVAK